MKSRSKASAKRAPKKRAPAHRATNARRVKARSAPTVPVTVVNFQRAESHMYFAKAVEDGAFGCLGHHRAPVAIDSQEIIRLNRDTLYSFSVFDLDAGPVTIELPNVGDRFMSLLMIDEDHYTTPVVYAPGAYTFTREQVGTRYVFAAIRTLADPGSKSDVKEANAAQDRIRVQQAAKGTFEIPNWDPAARNEIRNLLLKLSAKAGTTTEERFGARRRGRSDSTPADDSRWLGRQSEGGGRLCGRRVCEQRRQDRPSAHGQRRACRRILVDQRLQRARFLREEQAR